MLRPLILSSLIILFTLPLYAHAEEPEAPATEAAEESYPVDEIAVQEELKPADESDPWKYFTPPKDDFDWIQLDSGEWLKGEIKVLYNEELEFDSDELGILTLELEDIRLIRGGNIKNVRVNGPLTFYGLLQVTEEQVIITQGETQRIFNRSDLVSITGGSTNELEKWSAKLSLGLDLSAGNTEQTNFSGSADIRRRTADNRFVLTSLTQYSKAQDVVTADNNRINAFYDVFRSRQFYLRPLFGEYFRDSFQNIRDQYSIGTGMGYQIIDKAKTEWSATAGVAYQNTQFESVETGEDDNISTAALVLGTSYETALTRKVDFTGNYQMKLLNEASGTYTHHATIDFETELTSWLDFDITLVWDYIRDPTASADGTVPESNDYKLIFALGVEY